MTKSRIVNIVLAVVIFVIGAACGIAVCKARFFRHGERGRLGEMRAERKGGPGDMMMRLDKKLQLSEDQKKKIQIILEDQKKEMEKLMKETHPKIEAQMENVRKKIRETLDDNQKTEFDKIMVKIKEREKKFGGQSRRRGPKYGDGEDKK